MAYGSGDMNKPIVNHISILVNGFWRTQTFLPIFSDQLVWCEDVNDRFCGDCPLACYAHPMVEDETRKYCYHKLCTLTVIKASLINLKEVLLDKGGCNQKSSDYQRARELLDKLKKVPVKGSRKEVFSS